MQATKRIGIVAAAAVSAAAAWAFTHSGKSNARLAVSGTIEARNIKVGSKTGGRIQSILVREGDRVGAGQVLVTFDDAESAAEVAQAAARVASAQATLNKLEAGYRSEEIAEARAQLGQAEASAVEAEHGYRPEEIGEATAERERASADEANAKTTYQRMEKLFQDEVVSRQQRDDAKARWDQAVAVLGRTSNEVAKLQAGYRTETIANARARLQEAQASLAKMEHGYRPEEIAAAKAELAQAQAACAELGARHGEATITAPADAVVEVLDARPGDLLAPNTPVITLLEEGQVFVRVYVAETKIGAVKLGQTADVFVDSFPGKAWTAVVEQINQQTEFLPRNVQTQEERAHQVIGVKLRLQNAQAVRAGMAADVALHVEEN
jgi:multidrug resistance efflux pump